MPPAWRAGRPPRPKATATIGRREPSALGLDGLLDFKVETTLDGEPLTEAEVRSLLAGTDGLALLRGQWVEVDRARLEQAMTQFRDAESLAAREGVSFAEAMRMLAGAAVTQDEADAASAGWARDRRRALARRDAAALRGPERRGRRSRRGVEGRVAALSGRRRRAGSASCRGLGLGACLADDMGLGKTIQVLALLLPRQRDGAEAAGPSLLVAPASLLANWAGEIEQFAPSLKVAIVHPSAMNARGCAAILRRVVRGRRSRRHELRVVAAARTRSTEIAWRFVILDEAQAIKNADAKQTRAVKALKARARIALTGTPVENHLGDLWSIFDFLNPGLLGSAKQFSASSKRLADREHRSLRAAAQAGRALHPAAPEDRPSRSSPICPTRPRSRRIAI